MGVCADMKGKGCGEKMDVFQRWVYWTATGRRIVYGLFVFKILLAIVSLSNFQEISNKALPFDGGCGCGYTRSLQHGCYQTGSRAWVEDRATCGLEPPLTQCRAITPDMRGVNADGSVYENVKTNNKASGRDTTSEIGRRARGVRGAESGAHIFPAPERERRQMSRRTNESHNDATFGVIEDKETGEAQATVEAETEDDNQSKEQLDQTEHLVLKQSAESALEKARKLDRQTLGTTSAAPESMAGNVCTKEGQKEGTTMTCFDTGTEEEVQYVSAEEYKEAFKEYELSNATKAVMDGATGSSDLSSSKLQVDGETTDMCTVVNQLDGPYCGNPGLTGFLGFSLYLFVGVFYLWFTLALGRFTCSPTDSCCPDKCCKDDEGHGMGSREYPGPKCLKNPISCEGAPEQVLGCPCRSTVHATPKGKGACCSHGYFGMFSPEFREIYSRNDEESTNVAIAVKTMMHLRHMGWIQAFTLQLIGMSLAAYFISICGSDSLLEKTLIFTTVDVVLSLIDVSVFAFYRCKKDDESGERRPSKLASVFNATHSSTTKKDTFGFASKAETDAANAGN